MNRSFETRRRHALAELTGNSYASLDRQYRDFISRGETVQQPPDQAAR